MNELQRALFGAPSFHAERCPFCGRPATNRHHIVPRSQGGTDGATIDVCGAGNASGCHGKLHAHTLHLRYCDGKPCFEVRVRRKNLKETECYWCCLMRSYFEPSDYSESTCPKNKNKQPKRKARFNGDWL